MESNKRISFKGGSGYIPKKQESADDEIDFKDASNQQKTIISKLKETLKV